MSAGKLFEIVFLALRMPRLKSSLSGARAWAGLFRTTFQLRLILKEHYQYMRMKKIFGFRFTLTILCAKNGGQTIRLCLFARVCSNISIIFQRIFTNNLFLVVRPYSKHFQDCNIDIFNKKKTDSVMNSSTNP